MRISAKMAAHLVNERGYTLTVKEDNDGDDQ